MRCWKEFLLESRYKSRGSDHHHQFFVIEANFDSTTLASNCGFNFNKVCDCSSATISTSIFCYSASNQALQIAMLVGHQRPLEEKSISVTESMGVTAGMHPNEPNLDAPFVGCQIFSRANGCTLSFPLDYRQ